MHHVRKTRNRRTAKMRESVGYMVSLHEHPSIPHFCHQPLQRHQPGQPLIDHADSKPIYGPARKRANSCLSNPYNNKHTCTGICTTAVTYNTLHQT